MLNYFMTLLNSKLRNEEGQGMIEYVLLVALIAIVVIVVLQAMGPAIAARFQEIIDAL